MKEFFKGLVSNHISSYLIFKKDFLAANLSLLVAENLYEVQLQSECPLSVLYLPPTNALIVLKPMRDSLPTRERSLHARWELSVESSWEPCFGL